MSVWVCFPKSKARVMRLCGNPQTGVMNMCIDEDSNREFNAQIAYMPVHDEYMIRHGPSIYMLIWDDLRADEEFLMFPKDFHDLWSSKLEAINSGSFGIIYAIPKCKRTVYKFLKPKFLTGKEGDLDRHMISWVNETQMVREVLNWMVVSENKGDTRFVSGYYSGRHINMIIRETFTQCANGVEEFIYPFILSPHGGIYIKNTRMDCNLSDFIDNIHTNYDGSDVSTSDPEILEGCRRLAAMVYYTGDGNGGWNAFKKVHIKMQLTAAVHYLQKIDAVHFDLKPEQFLCSLDEPNQSVHIRLTDFGGMTCFNTETVNRFLGPNSKMAPVYKIGSRRGAYVHTAPEILLGMVDCHYNSEQLKDIDIASAPANMLAVDRWGLGMIMHHFDAVFYHSRSADMRDDAILNKEQVDANGNVLRNANGSSVIIDKKDINMARRILGTVRGIFEIVGIPENKSIFDSRSYRNQKNDNNNFILLQSVKYIYDNEYKHAPTASQKIAKYPVTRALLDYDPTKRISTEEVFGLLNKELEKLNAPRTKPLFELKITKRTPATIRLKNVLNKNPRSRSPVRKQ